MLQKTMNKCKAKLSIACEHILNENAKPILVHTMEPEDERDSGRLYACASCDEKGPDAMFRGGIDHWATVCDDCIIEKANQ